VDLRKNKTFSVNVTLDMPKNIVPGSEHVEVSAVGKYETSRDYAN
jgi:hypothetical protein